MTATPAVPTAEAHQPMAPAVDSQPEPAPTPESHVPSSAQTAPVAEMELRRRSRLLDDPLLTFLVMLAVAMLTFIFTDLSGRSVGVEGRINRLDEKIDRLNEKMEAGLAAVDARFDAQDEKFDARFDAQDEKFDARFNAQDEKFDEINLKLTALIAGLNMEAEVKAALEGRLADAPAP